MSTRTIDNLGVDVSIRYAKDQQLLDAHLFQEDALVSRKTETIAYKPYLASDFDQRFFFASRTTSRLAFFQPPPNYFQGSSDLFSYQLIPSLGDDEQQEADLEKLTLWKEKRDKKDKRNRHPAAPHIIEEEIEDPNDERQRETLVALLECISRLNRDLELAISCRNQYQRG
jgi:hypothetical protein